MYRLESPELEITFDSNAAITAIRDKRNGREYIENHSFQNGWRLMLPDETWDGRYADGKAQRNCLVISGTDTIKYIFSSITAADRKQVNVELTIIYRLEKDELHAKYKINNLDDQAFPSHIMFPVIRGIGKKEKGMKLVMPEQSPFGDTRVEDPFSYGDGNHKDWVRGCNRKNARYPLQLATAWMDYSDMAGGITLEQRSPEFSVCDFGFERIIRKGRRRKAENEDFLQFAIQSYPNVRWGEEAESPDYVIEIHENNWQVPALRHREWLKKHVRLPVLPETMKRSIGWHFYFMKQQDGTVYFQYRDLPDMAEAAVSAGLGYMMVFGWYPAGHDNDYPFGYFVNEEWGGEQELHRQLEKCCRTGCSVIPFFNGTLLDISLDEYRQYAHRWPVLGRTQKPYCGTEFSRANHDMGFSNACIPTSTRNMTLLDVCITSEEVQKWWRETVTRIVRDYHFHNIQLDQIAHKSYVCYAPHHKHRRPETAWTDELGKLLSMVRQIVKEDQEGVVIGEGMTDLTMQYCDAFWNWHQAFNRPEIIRYSIPWMNYSHEIDANEYDAANICFAERILMDLKIEGGIAKVTDYPEFTAHLKRLAELKKRLGRAYIDGEYFLQDGLKVECSEGILVRIYRCEAETAIVIAGISEGRGTIVMELEKPLKNVRLYSNYGIREGGDGSRFSCKIEPYEVVVIEGMQQNI